MYCSYWEDLSFTGAGSHTQVNKVLGSICRLHYPGMVTKPGGTGEIVATSWKHYKMKVDADCGDKQGRVWVEFWVCFLTFVNRYVIHLYVITNR